MGATGLEPVTVAAEDVEGMGLAKGSKADANACANTFPENPLEKLAEAWETLPPDVQAKIAKLVEQATGKA